jgi:hypothetical protein
VSKEAEQEQGARGAAEPNPYLRSVEERPELYGTVSALFAKYFDLYGEEEEAKEEASA